MGVSRKHIKRSLPISIWTSCVFLFSDDRYIMGHVDSVLFNSDSILSMCHLNNHIFELESKAL